MQTFHIAVNLDSGAPLELRRALVAGVEEAHGWGALLSIGWQMRALVATLPVVGGTMFDGDSPIRERELQWQVEEARDRALLRCKELEVDTERRLRDSVADVNRQRDRDAEHYKTRIEHETLRIRDLCSQIQMGEVARLKEALSSKEAKIALLRDRNVVKGVQAEFLVQETLLVALPDHELVDVPSRPHSRDVDLVTPAGMRIMVECKNKMGIAKADVVRFMSDLRDHWADAAGGVFISVRSMAIPGRGPFKVERINDNGQPCMFIGFGCLEECATQLPGFVKAFMALCAVVKQGATADGVDWGGRWDPIAAVLRDVSGEITRQRLFVRQSVTNHNQESQTMLERPTSHITNSEVEQPKKKRKTSPAGE